MTSLFLPVHADEESLIFPLTIGRSFLVLLELVAPHGIQSMHRSWFMDIPSVDAFTLLIFLQNATTVKLRIMIKKKEMCISYSKHEPAWFLDYRLAWLL